MLSFVFTIEASIPVCHRPFSLWESTGSKQTLNGLFLCFPVPENRYFKCQSSFLRRGELRDNYFLFIRTTKPHDQLIPGHLQLGFNFYFNTTWKIQLTQRIYRTA
jgi:hypothetical protein